MPVDTYLKRKNLSRYETLERADLTIHVAPALRQWASAVLVDAERFLLWRRFRVLTQHRHQPT